MINSRVGRRRIAVGIGALAVVAMGTLSSCAEQEKAPEPTTTTTTTTTTEPSVTPTEKGIDPTGGNKFTPTVKAPPPATAIPGNN